MKGISIHNNKTVKEIEQKELGSVHTSKKEKYLVLPCLCETLSTLQKGILISCHINCEGEEKRRG